MVSRYLDKSLGDYDWGLLQWAPKILDVFFDSQLSLTVNEFIIKKKLKKLKFCLGSSL